MQNEVIKNINNNAYYEEARSWYSTVYLSLISERFFYIVLTSIAFCTLLLSIVSLISLLPITPTMPFLYQARNVKETIPRFIKLSDNNQENTNQALRRFFVKEYIQYREDYSRNTIAINARFILNHSVPEAYSVYRQFMNQGNPRSPISIFEAKAIRSITIKKMVITPVKGEANKYRADIDFNAEVFWYSDSKLSKWNTVVLFDYQDIKLTEKTDEEKELDDSDSSLNVEPMIFKVTRYESRSY